MEISEKYAKMINSLYENLDMKEVVSAMISSKEFYFLLLKNYEYANAVMKIGSHEEFKYGCYTITIRRADLRHHHAFIEIDNVILGVVMDCSYYDPTFRWMSRPPTEMELTKIRLAL